MGIEPRIHELSSDVGLFGLRVHSTRVERNEETGGVMDREGDGVGVGGVVGEVERQEFKKK